VLQPRPLFKIALFTGTLLLAGTGWAQKIYTCVDKNGRRLTSDRPIMECIDREQRELGRSGVVQRVIPPSQTLEDKARADAERKAAEQSRQKATEALQRDRALVLRYPNQATHNRARAEALSQVDLVIEGLSAREQSLVARIVDIDRQLTSFSGQPDSAPALLRRQRLDTDAELGQQRRLLQQQRVERERIDARFDDELGRLQKLWTGEGR
jgi:hypothetical protein